jgi:hypothetical protein
MNINEMVTFMNSVWSPWTSGKPYKFDSVVDTNTVLTRQNESIYKQAQNTNDENDMEIK